ncbi:MAG TPA: FkbM family methyltransferase [Rariglobus sp.]|jgi:hypothetical protein|nr:FkbM family methyltransferase [Rariglobus sp.]
MNLTRVFKWSLKAALSAGGYEVYKRPYLPKGADAFQSLKAHWPDWKPGVIFDVGANAGQTVERLRPLFPNAGIYAFEPVPSTYAALQKNVSKDPRVHPQLLGLSDQYGEASIYLQPSSDQNSLNPVLAAPTQPTGIPI